PVPTEGNTWGHYHATIVCEDWWLDGEPRPGLLLGFVGPKVETPAFAPDAADDAYLATVLATNDATLYEKLAAAGVPVMWAQGWIQQSMGEMDVSMETDHNGEYRSIFAKKHLGAHEDGHTRIWVQQEHANGTVTPLALDFHDQGGEHYGAEGQGYFHHAGTDHHAPLPGAYGKTAAVVYEGFDRTVSFGPAPDVLLPAAYHH
ncbi:MAG: hypothetical protein R3185_07715, partial [Candidatus Thermoplasmatota archaeon]|nr:hypothetical protein [Candidatus Thermoplasmatota archaeon]